MILTHGANSTKRNSPLPNDIIAIIQGDKQYGLSSIDRNNVSYNEVSGVLNEPVMDFRDDGTSIGVVRFLDSSVLSLFNNPSKSITMEVWSKVIGMDAGSGWGSPVLSPFSETSIWNLGFAINYGNLDLRTFVNDVSSKTFSKTQSWLNDYHHFAVTLELNVNKFNVKFYVDGLKVDEASSVSPNSSDNFMVLFTTSKTLMSKIQFILWDGVKYTGEFTPPRIKYNLP